MTFGDVSTTELDIKDADMISLDLGKSFGLAIWNDGKCCSSHTLLIDDKYAIPHLYKIHREIEEILVRHHPILVLEKPGRSLAFQWVQYTDIDWLAYRQHCKLYRYVTTAIKKEVTGFGRAGKDVMEEAVTGERSSEYCVPGLVLSNEHEVDAVACGICHLMKTSHA